MATLHCFAVLDRAAKAYGRPFYAATESLGKRMFAEAVNDQTPENLINKYPSDFALFLVGQYDEDSGDLTPMPHVQPICEAQELVKL